MFANNMNKYQNMNSTYKKLSFILVYSSYIKRGVLPEVAN